jgi:hypothetical protein
VSPTRTWNSPVEFRTSPAPCESGSPGRPADSSAAAPIKGWATVTALLRAAAGRLVAIGT